MGFRELGFSLLILVFVINLASSYPIPMSLRSEFMQKSKTEDKKINGSKIEGASNHGAPHGGNSHGNGDGDGGSGSHQSPKTQAGAAVIPIIAGGAANNNRNRQIHHGAATCNLNNFSTMLMITLVHLLMLFL